MSSGRHHAIIADDLLENVHRLDNETAAMTEDERLRMVATGGYTRLNRDLDYTVRLATAHALLAAAHALAALAMHVTDRETPPT
jgi:hypothetical protein